MIETLNEENASVDLVVKTQEGSGISTYEVERLMELTLAGIEQNETDVKVLIGRANRGGFLQEFLAKNDLAEEKIREAFSIWALNLWQLGRLIADGVVGNTHLKVGVHREDFDDARRFYRISAEEIRSRIEDLGERGRLSKVGFRQTFTRVKKAASTNGGSSGPSIAGSGFIRDVLAQPLPTEEPLPMIIEEDATLVALYECMLVNPEHYLEGRFKADTAYQQLCANASNRKLINVCLRRLLEALEAFSEK